jgi:hypothetical protein
MVIYLQYEVVSQRLELAGTDQRAGQVQESGQDVGAALVTDRQAPVGQQPGQGTLDVPAMAAQRVLDSTHGGQPAG